MLSHPARFVVGLVLIASLAACSTGPSEIAKLSDETLLGGSQQGSFTAVVKEGDQAWADREVRERVKVAIRRWEEAVKTNDPNMSEAQRRQVVYELYVKLARAHFFLADGHIALQDKPEINANRLEDLYQQGRAFAERAMGVYDPAFRGAMAADNDMSKAVMLLDEGAAEAMYWWAMNFGRWLTFQSDFVALGAIDDLKTVVSRVEKFRPEYDCYGPARYFGGYYTFLPAFNPDVERSKMYFDQALEGAPTCLNNNVAYAELYLVKTGRDVEFNQVLEAVIATPDDINPDHIPENKAEKARARLLLNKQKELFE